MRNINGGLGTTFKIMCFVVKKTNGRLGAIFKILCFVVRNDGRLGTVFKILCFPEKKRMAVWVHAFSFNNSSLVSFLLCDFEERK